MRKVSVLTPLQLFTRKRNSNQDGWSVIVVGEERAKHWPADDICCTLLHNHHLRIWNESTSVLGERDPPLVHKHAPRFVVALLV